MNKQDLESTLLKSSMQEPGARAGYLKLEAEKNKIDPIIFLERLKEAYQRLSEYVNYVPKIKLPDGTLIVEEWGITEDWKVGFGKRSLNLIYAYPGKGIAGHLDCTNITKLREAINEFENGISERERPTVIKNERYDCLFAAFIDPEKYQRIRNYLVSTEYCAEGTLRWLKGKENLVGFLKDLHRKTYLHRKLTHAELKIISSNDFGVNLGQRVCSTNPDRVSIPEIPPASAL